MFISYSRHDGEFVRPLVRALEARGKDVWVDLDDIPKSADWHARVEQGIEASKAVVVVLSPALAASQICGEEIRHAIEHNKRLIPILRTDVEPEQLYPELNAPNWILARDQDDGEAAFEELVAALETDLAWLEVHARLVARSVEWDRQNRDGSFLLRGDDLGTARRWLAARAEHREQPTELQVEYIGASRRSALIRRAMVGVAALGVVALAGFLLVQRERTSDEQRESASKSRSGWPSRGGCRRTAIAQLDTDSRRALATALKAHAAAPTPEATQALRQALMQPRREATLSVPGQLRSGRPVHRRGHRSSSDRGRQDPALAARRGESRCVLRRGPPPRTWSTPRPAVPRTSSRARSSTVFASPPRDKGTVVAARRPAAPRRGKPCTAALSPDGRRVADRRLRAAADVWRVPARVIRPPRRRALRYARPPPGLHRHAATTADAWRSGPRRRPSARQTTSTGPGDDSTRACDLDVGASADGTQVFVTSQRPRRRSP